MKTPLKVIAAMVFLILLACNKDDAPKPAQKSSAKKLIAFVFRATDNSALSADVTATINENTRSITAVVPSGTELTALLPKLEISEKATVSPTGPADFTNEVTYTVTAEDGTTANYSTLVSTAQPDANEPPGSFVLNEVPNNSIDVVPAPTFSWTPAADPDGDPVTYDLYLDREEEPAYLMGENLATTTFTLTNFDALSLKRDYHWKVVAKDGKGGQTASAVFTFKVQGLNDAQQVTQNTLFSPVSNHATVVFADEIWVLGGFGINGNSKEVWSSLDGAQWTSRDSLFQPVFFHAATTFNDKMWVHGGVENGNFSSLATFAEATSKWGFEDQSVNDEFTPRAEQSLTGFNNRLWVIGGGGTADKLADVWSSDTGADWVRSIEEADFGKRNLHQTVSFQDRLWVIGGIDNDGNFKNDVWSSTDGVNWIGEVANTQFPGRGGHSALVFDDKIWIVGGMTQGGGANDIWYSEDGVEWIDATPENTFPAKDGFTAAFHDNKIWVLGGDMGSEVWSIAYHDFEN